MVLVLGIKKFWSDWWMLCRMSVFYRALIFVAKVSYSIKLPFTALNYLPFLQCELVTEPGLWHSVDGPCMLSLLIGCLVGSLGLFQCHREVWSMITITTWLFPFHSHPVIWSLGGWQHISGDGLESIISHQLITLCMPTYRPQCSDFLFFREKCRFK